MDLVSMGHGSHIFDQNILVGIDIQMSSPVGYIDHFDMDLAYKGFYFRIFDQKNLVDIDKRMCFLELHIVHFDMDLECTDHKLHNELRCNLAYIDT